MATPGDVWSIGQRLPLPSCKTLTNQVWMAAGHPNLSLGSLTLCFEMSTAKTFQMQVWVAMDHPRENSGCLKLRFRVSSVVAAAVSSKEQEWPLVVCKPSKTRSRWQKNIQNVSMAFSGGSEIVWFLVLWQKLVSFAWRGFETRGVDDSGPSKTKFRA